MITTGFASYRDVCTIICDYEIYDRINDDNSPPLNEYVVPRDGYIAIGGYINKQIVSLYMIHDRQIHFMVLKPFRKYAGKLWEALFLLHPHSGYCRIPSLYGSLINFAKRYNFKETSIDRLAHKKNGKLYDVRILEV